MQCPHCGVDNSATNSFCEACGRRWARDVSFATMSIGWVGSRFVETAATPSLNRISVAAAAIDMVDRMTADLSHFELLEAYARAALAAAAAQVHVELNVGMIIHRPDAMVLRPLFALCPIDKH
jgi:hypothetical protein